jgi:multicomponent Na+:H+ antiporter subunit F
MTAPLFLEIALGATFLMLCAAFVLVVVRIARGPSLPDRILGLDLLVMVAVGTIAVFGIRTGYAVYVDIAIALGLVGFLSTVALARFVLRRGDAAARGEG